MTDEEKSKNAWQKEIEKKLEGEIRIRILNAYSEPQFIGLSSKKEKFQHGDGFVCPICRNDIKDGEYTHFGYRANPGNHEQAHIGELEQILLLRCVRIMGT